MRRVLIDTNLLILLLVGTFDRTMVPRFKRTATFTPSDFDVLARWLAGYPTWVTTQSVLAEASNLVGNAFHETVSGSFAAVCRSMVEVARPMQDIVDAEAFARLGFADASILVALDEETALLTDDVQLYLQAAYEDRRAFNFNHVRHFGV